MLKKSQTKNIKTQCMKISRCACVCMWVSVLMHEDVPKGCLGCAWHGIEAQTEQNV